MIRTKILFIFVPLLALGYSRCPDNCGVCVNQTSCSQCSLGYFFANNAYCLPCPTDCMVCIPGSYARPICLICFPNFQLGQDNVCLECYPSCLTCSGDPQNCTSCRPGKKLLPRANNNTMVCGQDQNCPIKNCAQCGINSLNQTVCLQCLSGYFTFGIGCSRCSFPCQDCRLDQANVWTTLIAPFWDNNLRAAFNITTLNPPENVLPYYANNLNFQNMTNAIKYGWSEAFWFIKSLQLLSTRTSPRAIIQLIPALISLINQNINSTEQSLRAAVLRRINILLGKNLTQIDLNNLAEVAAGKVASCSMCINGYRNTTYMTNTSAPCQKCQINCLTCFSGPCDSCSQGYFLDSQGYCVACTSPCATCSSSATTCLSCKAPFTLANNSCILCQQPCDRCSSINTSICTSCKATFSIFPSARGVCFRCKQELCLICLETNISICIACIEGSTVVDGVCQQCPANCASCTGGPNIMCFACLEGNVLALQNNLTRCLRCRAGCKRCDHANSSICFQCQTGTFLNRDTGRCRKCPVGCEQCQSQTVCRVYSTGIVFYLGQLVDCRPGCESCDSTSPHICTSCSLRFYLEDSLCKPCSTGCIQCSSPFNCATCADGLKLVNNSCVPCASTCSTCGDNVNECTSCIMGFTRVRTRCVRSCEAGCLECSGTNSSICLTCLPGHALKSNGKCVKCLYTCSGRCDPKNINICISCVDGFQIQDNKCLRCPAGCATCLNGQCSTCVDGFSLNQTASGSFVCQQNCRFPCSMCSGDQCTACSTGFILKNNQCSPDLSCNPDCPFCPAGTQKLANGSCQLCPANCASCVNRACFACMGGYYIDSGSCTSCPSQCLTCFDAHTCDKCRDGYVKQVLSMGLSGISSAVYGSQCIRCSQNCKTCQVYPYQCTSCQEWLPPRYRFRCKGLWHVKFQFKLDANYFDFMENSQSEEVLSKISIKTGVNLNETYLQYVNQGSVVIGGTIQASDRERAQTIQSNLGSSLDGYLVVSSSVSIYYADMPFIAPPKMQYQTIPTQQPVNVGLIVGVVVGGVVLILVIIGCIIYAFKYRKTQREGQQRQQQNQNQEQNIQSAHVFKGL